MKEGTRNVVDTVAFKQRSKKIRKKHHVRKSYIVKNILEPITSPHGLTRTNNPSANK